MCRWNGGIIFDHGVHVSQCAHHSNSSSLYEARHFEKLLHTHIHVCIQWLGFSSTLPSQNFLCVAKQKLHILS